MKTIATIKWLLRLLKSNYHPLKVQTIIHVSLSLAVFSILMVTRTTSHQQYDRHLNTLDHQVNTLAVFRDSLRIREQVRFREVELLSEKVKENEKVLVKLDSNYANLTRKVQRYQVTERKALALIDKSDNAGLVNIFAGIPVDE